MFSVDAVEMVQKAVTVPINKNDGHIDVEVKEVIFSIPHEGYKYPYKALTSGIQLFSDR